LEGSRRAVLEPLIGSAIGGGGTAVAYGTGKKDVGFGVERRLTFKLTQPLVIKG